MRDLPPIDLALVAFAAIVLGHALQINNGFYDPAALAYVTFAAALCVTAMLRGMSRLTGQDGTEAMVAGVLVAGLISNLLALAISPIALDLDSPAPFDHPGFLVMLGAAAAFLGIVTLVPRRRDGEGWRWMILPLVLLYAGAGAWLIAASPRPHIDVVTVSRAAIVALRRLDSPYSISFANIYENSAYYAPGTVSGGAVQFGFPYPPLALLMMFVAQRTLHDIRYAQLAALCVGAVWMALSARGRLGVLAAGALLFTPRAFFVLEQAWTEPLAVCWLAFTTWAAVRHKTIRGYAFGLLLAVKQHLILTLPFASFLGAPGDERGSVKRVILQALGVAAGITLPFFLWDSAGFWRSVVTLQFHDPFRLDSLSVLSPLAMRGWPVTGLAATIVPLASLLGALTFALWRAPRTPSGFALATGFVMLMLFLFSKKAFCNYYFLVIAALLTSVAASGGWNGPDRAAVNSDWKTREAPVLPSSSRR